MNSLKLASGETIEVTSEEIIAAQAENGTLKLSGEQVSERAEDAYSNTANEDTNGEPTIPLEKRRYQQAVISDIPPKGRIHFIRYRLEDKAYT